MGGRDKATLPAGCSHAGAGRTGHAIQRGEGGGQVADGAHGTPQKPQEERRKSMPPCLGLG